ncbi:hypothetical protein KR084_010628 [Drosophila pseudotakahashii]|nr:hypothetical protein KR084_010628 [Drosophila pseudotakahashii]
MAKPPTPTWEKEDAELQYAAPVEQRDAPSLKEALEVCPTDGPRPLTIAEYRARQQKKIKTKKKRSGRRHNLLRQRRLAKDLIKTAATTQEATQHEEQLRKIEDQLRTGAK